MGMYDDIKCSYDIGKLTDRGCQSKDFDPYGGYHVFLLGRPSMECSGLQTIMEQQQ